MNRKYLLEISVESGEAAAAAERGGAHRIEFCSNAREGGTTPTPEMLRAVRECVRIPIMSMVRPRAGNFVYSAAEFEEMAREIEVAKKEGMDGIVVGMLNGGRAVDLERTKALAVLARPLPVTFHRAFDECVDLRKSLEDVIQTGATRLLTSGGRQTAAEAVGVLGKLVEQASERLIVMPGSGITPANIAEVARGTRAREYHAGLSSLVARPAANLRKFEQAVRELADALASCA